MVVYLPKNVAIDLRPLWRHPVLAGMNRACRENLLIGGDQAVAMFMAGLQTGSRRATRVSPHLKVRQGGAACTTDNDRDAERHSERAVRTTLYRCPSRSGGNAFDTVTNTL